MSDSKDTRLSIEAVESVKDKLKPHQYEALLQWADGQKYIHIALHLGVPAGTVKSRVNRGRAAVVKFMAEFAHQKPGV